MSSEDAVRSQDLSMVEPETLITRALQDFVRGFERV
jgi:hypothetical protein